MMRNDVMVAARLTWDAPIGSGRPADPATSGTAAHHSHCGRRSHSGVFAPGHRARKRAEVVGGPAMELLPFACVIVPGSDPLYPRNRPDLPRPPPAAPGSGRDREQVPGRAGETAA